MLKAQGNINNEKKPSILRRWKKIILQRIGLTRNPVVKLYNGYGHNEQLVVYGHAFSLSPVQSKKYTGNIFRNTFSMLKLFMVRPYAGAVVTLNWDDETFTTQSEDDGFFRIEWKPAKPLPPGWHPVTVSLESGVGSRESGVGNRESEVGSRESAVGSTEIISTGQGHVYVPHSSQYAFISDIDDTFLISHSSNLRKRLYVLLTKNAHSRKPFEGVADHYQLLAHAGTSPDAPNPFFYVSSSEWNLYDYILDFSYKHSLPKGIYLLSQLKQLRQVWKTGQNKHATKFMRIARILESYPDQKYVLLGDDSQADPDIYVSIVEHFKDKVVCVYLRHVHKKNADKVKLIVKKIEDAGVHCCYFTKSADAISHSRKIGLIL